MNEWSSCPGTPTLNDGQNSLMLYLHHLSGQKKEINLLDVDHGYAKPWNRHPDPLIKSRPAKFLFMNNFPKHFLKPGHNVTYIDVDTIPESTYNDDVNPFIAEVQSLMPRTPTTLGHPSFGSDDAAYLLHEKAPVDKRSWSPSMQKLWAKTLKILQADRLARLVCEGRPNEIIVRRNLLEKATNRLRQVFASVVLWDPHQLAWLNNTLHQHITPIFLVTYHEALQLLRQKVPTLVDKFYNPPKLDGSIAPNSNMRNKQIQSDPIQTVLNNHRPKRINGSPLFLIVPNGPQIPHHFTSQRMKHWHNLFGSLGKVITVTVTQKSYSTAADCLIDIRLAVKDKIKECKMTFNEGRPLVLVGFGASSIIAAHCALDNASHVTATICLGFPLTGVNGFRGDLDDPLLETTVPTLFVIGQSSTMCTLDDMEDFRERIVKTETGLLVVGGCNDRLIVCGAKKRTDGMTQGMVDRCVADEIYDFVSCVLNPNHSSNDLYGAPSSQSSSRSLSGAKSAANSLKASPLAQIPGVVKKRRKYIRKSEGDKTSVSEANSPAPSVGTESGNEKVDKEESFEKVVEKVEKKARTPKRKRAGSASVSVPVTPEVKSPPRTPSTPMTITAPSTPEVAPVVEPEQTPPHTTSKKPRLSVETVVKSESPEPQSSNINDTISAVAEFASAVPVAQEATPTCTPMPGTPTHDRSATSVYGLATVPSLVGSSSTRTGRQIRAPKQLDI